MAKRRPTQHRKRAIDPLARPRRHPPWGATKAQAQRYQAERDLKNKIHELETALHGANVVIKNLVESRDRLRRLLDAVCTPREMEAMRSLRKVPIYDADHLGIGNAILTLSAWLARLEGGVVENVRIALDTSEVASGK